MVRDQIDENYENALRTLSPLRYGASFIEAAVLHSPAAVWLSPFSIDMHGLAPAGLHPCSAYLLRSLSLHGQPVRDAYFQAHLSYKLLACLA